MFTLLIKGLIIGCAIVAQLDLPFIYNGNV